MNNSQGIFETLRFTTQADVNGTILQHPPTDLITPLGRQNRAKFLRTWVELGAWVANYSRVHGEAIQSVCYLTVHPLMHQAAAQLKDASTVRSWVKVDSVREMYQTAIGAHPDQSKASGYHSRFNHSQTQYVNIASSSWPAW